MKRPFRRTVVFDNLCRSRGERDARLRLYPQRGLVSVLAAGGVGYQKGITKPPAEVKKSDG